MPAPPAEAASSRPVIPGTLVEVLRSGVLLTGDSGVGKTDLVLSLLDRGHYLIVDDAVALEQHQGRLWGRAPEPLRGLLAVRGLGVLDAATLFGPAQLKDTTAIDLVIELDSGPPGPDPLAVQQDSVAIMGVAIPRLRLPLGRHRDRPLLVELAVRAQRSRTPGGEAEVARAVIGGE